MERPERFRQTRNLGPTSAETICELQQKAAVPNYFRPQATTVDNLITMAIPAATWPFSTYIRTRCRTIHVDPCTKMRFGPFAAILPSNCGNGRRDFEIFFLSRSKFRLSDD